MAVAQKNEQKALNDLERAQSNLARLQKIEANMNFACDAISKVGIRYLSDQTNGAIERTLICEEKDLQWTLEWWTSEHGCFGVTKKQPLDATDAASEQIVGNCVNLQWATEIRLSIGSQLCLASHKQHLQHPLQLNPHSGRQLHLAQQRTIEAGRDKDHGLFNPLYRNTE